MYAIVGLVFVSTMFYFLSDYLVNLGRQTGKKVSLTQGRMVLHSLTDYTIYGIKKRWCFDDFWLPLGGAACAISHPRSVERLIISDDSLRIYNQMAASGSVPGGAILALQEISAVVDLQGMLPDHPLFPIVQSARVMAPIAKADIRISRDRRPQMPVGGREMFLNLQIRILDASDQVVQWQGLPMTIKANISVFPRELGSFALIAARDLRLDMGYADTADLGDLVIHQFGSRSATAGWPGLVFESPVFVNRNLVLPSSPMDANIDDPRYAAVTFADKVFLGQGQVMRNGAMFRPRTSGDRNDHLWNQVREFGGMNRGIEVDGEDDDGLNVLSGNDPSALVNEGQLDQCRRLAAVRSRLEYTRSSQIAAAFKGGTFGPDGLRYRIGFSLSNWVIPQEWSNNDVGQFQLTAVNTLARNGNQNFNIGATNGLGAYTGRTWRIGETIQGTYSPEEHRDLQQYRNRLRDLQRELRDLERANPPDPVAIAAKQAEIAAVEAQIRTWEEIDARQTSVELLIQTAVTALGPQPNYVDILIRASNPNAFVNSDGQPLRFTVGVRGLDVGCAGNRCRDERAMPWERNAVIESGVFLQQGYLNFDPAGAGLPLGISRSAGGGTLASQIPDENVNWRTLVEDCTFDSGSGYGGADWAGAPFLESTFFSWNFAPPATPPSVIPGPPTSRDYYQPGASTLIFNASNSRPPAAAEFQVKSLIDHCVIEATATFVTGFFNCRHLEILSRASPLRIVGTFILSKMTIHPSVYQFGLRWSSIYHPMATAELVSARILTPVSSPTTSCFTANILPTPIWHPHPSLAQNANGYNCSTLSLRGRAAPFTWTTVEPDCGLVAVGATSQFRCKNRVVKSVVFEISRESSL